MKLTAKILWKLFEKTGSVVVYLAYKEFMSLNIQ
ncbi:YqzL family protein [Anoxybacter fermentans]|nr:YqzL family protein [Anoxybacter fermentans]